MAHYPRRTYLISLLAAFGFPREETQTRCVGTDDIDHSIKMLQSFFFEHPRVHVVLQMSVIDLQSPSPTHQTITSAFGLLRRRSYGDETITPQAVYLGRYVARVRTGRRPLTGNRIAFNPKFANASASFSVKKYSKNYSNHPPRADQPRHTLQPKLKVLSRGE